MWLQTDRLRTNILLWWFSRSEEDTESLQPFERGQDSCSTSVLQHSVEGAWLWLSAMWMSSFLISMRTFLTIRRMTTALFVSRRRPRLLAHWLPGSLRCTWTMWPIHTQLCTDGISRWQVKSHPLLSRAIFYKMVNIYSNYSKCFYYCSCQLQCQTDNVGLWGDTCRISTFHFIMTDVYRVSADFETAGVRGFMLSCRPNKKVIRNVSWSGYFIVPPQNQSRNILPGTLILQKWQTLTLKKKESMWAMGWQWKKTDN